jgi:hypothetical protein
MKSYQYVWIGAFLGTLLFYLIFNIAYSPRLYKGCVTYNCTYLTENSPTTKTIREKLPPSNGEDFLLPQSQNYSIYVILHSSAHWNFLCFHELVLPKNYSVCYTETGAGSGCPYKFKCVNAASRETLISCNLGVTFALIVVSILCLFKYANDYGRIEYISPTPSFMC